jgi:hypothetical protein
MKLIPLSEIDNEKTFWCGTTLRFFYDQGVFYDYLMANAQWEGGMLLVNVTHKDGKKGLVYSGIVPFVAGSRGVNKDGMKHALGAGLENWFLIEE